MGGMSGSGSGWLGAERESHGVVIASVVELPPDRLAELQALYELLDPALPPLEHELVERALRAPGVTVFAAVDPPSRRLAGVVTLVTARTVARTRAWAEDLVVHPEFRGRGVGEALITACAEAAASLGAQAIDGTVHPARTSAVALYRRTGWEFNSSLAVRRPV
jgi:GNAT superfamily N-acetyltransferase